MKIISLLFSLLLISCTGGDSAEGRKIIDAMDPDNGASTLPEEMVEEYIQMASGTYRSACLPDSEDGHQYMITVTNYEIQIVKFNSRAGDNCGSYESFTKATYDINGNYLEFKETVYSYTDSPYNDATYICGQSYMLGNNTEYNIDGISCAQSFENTNIVIEENGVDSYIVNNIVVNKI